MKLLPFEFYSIHSKLPPEIILERLAEQIQPRSDRPNFDDNNYIKNKGKPYAGKINKNTFRIHRNTWQRNSFRPFIHGSVCPFPDYASLPD